MTRMWQELRQSVRSLRRGGLLIAIAIFSLGIGIGSVTTIFSAVDVFMLRPLPYPESQDLLSVYTTNQDRGWTNVSFSVPDFVDFRERSQTMDVAASRGTSFNLSEGDRPERAEGRLLTWNWLRVLGVQPALGRGFTEDEEVEGRDRVALISHGLWQRRFGADPNVLGSDILLDGEPHTIVGVMPPDFWYASIFDDVWVPFPVQRDEARNSHYINVLARLREGFTPAQAADEVGRIAEQLAGEYPETNTGNGARIETLHEDIFNEGFRVGTTISSLAVLFLLLIACANVANLLLTHAVGREREMAIRSALGAGRGRIVRHFLTESLLLSFAGGLLGVLLSVVGIRSLVSVMPSWFPRVNEIGLDARVLVFTAAIVILSALLVGTAPAIQGARISTAESLKEGGRGGTAARSGRLRKGLVIGEVSLALALLIASALLVQGFYNVRLADRGFDESDLLAFRVALPRQEYPDEAAVVAFHEELTERLEALPGVESVGATSILPSQGNNSWYYTLPGDDVKTDQDRKVTNILEITPGYFEAMDVPIVRGRGFERSDRQGTADVIVINEVLAARHWPNEEPIGREMVFGNTTSRIVGVARNTGVASTTPGELPMVYLPVNQTGRRNLAYLVESEAPLSSLIESIRAEVGAMDPDIPAYNMRPLKEIIDESLGGDTIMAKIMSVVAVIALVLALAGVYGVMAYSVSQRRQELGIRMALGARDGDVVGMILRQGTILSAIGILIGLGLAFAMARGVSFFLYGVGAFEPATYAGMAAALLLAGVVATYFPARRATHVDPVEALRAE
ncbi:MAG: ABC transporter permease [Candidatus Palauibacterales bacterium]|nr:ABC transporter permease [Candidatus Palauibacterales bacterium]